MSDDEKALAGLRAAFPHDHASLSLKAVKALRADVAAPSEVPADPADKFAADYRTLKPKKKSSPVVQGYYRMEAEHERFQPVQHKFTGVNQWARIALPQTDEAWAFDTHVGTVRASDHLCPSVAAVARKYEKRAEHEIARVDLLTPARLNGARFGAGALYLLYAAVNDPAPASFLAEGGGAFGKPQALYLGKVGGAPLRDSARFAFTAMADVDHGYRISLAITGSEPTELKIEAFLGVDLAQHYLTNTVRMQRITLADLEKSGIYTATSMQNVAAARVAQIGKAIVDDAKEPDWIESPRGLQQTEFFAKLTGADPTWDVPPKKP